MYKWGVYDFSEKEVDQIVTLILQHSYNNPIDRRKYTKQVISYAVNWNLLEQKEDGRYYHTYGNKFDYLHYTPQEVLWRLMADMLNEATGYSVVNDKRWHNVNIYTEKEIEKQERQSREDETYEYCKHHFADYRDDKIRMLLKLHKWGYIHFQYCGNVWRIEITEDKAIRSE